MVPPFSGSRSGLLAIFVISGFAGLIYQSIWSHYLGLFLGHAAYAQALVLAIFMGGMAAGSAWIARAGQRWRNLIRGYAVIEAVIGVLGLLFHWIFTSVAGFSYDTLIPALGTPWTVDIARWSIAALLILPQTILLGMTFPLMSGGLIRRYPGSAGNLLGGLYFTNSIGAAIGALAAVFVLLPWVGLPGAMTVAGVLNFVVAALAWWLAREPEPETATAVSGSITPEQSLRKNSLLRVVLFGTALSGAASFAYEIIWIRMLSMAVGSTMHAFELMLASFIAGIALGGFWVRTQADRTESPLRLVGWMQIFMGIAALASLAVYANAFAWVGWLMQALAKTDGGYALFNLGTATIAMAIMLPAAFFAGTTLPLFTVTLLRAGQGERSIGRVYAWNTLGSIIGVFAAIHLLIPTLGLKLALCVSALVDLSIGLFLLRSQAEDRRSMRRFAVAAGLAATALIVAVRVPFDPMTMASGVFRHGLTSLHASDQVLYYKDGKTASVAAVISNDGSTHISTNGKPDAAIQMRDGLPPTDDEPTMVLAATLPLAMLDAPRQVGVIGFGSGLTTHTLLGDPRLERVDTIEIEPAMVEGARVFGPRVERAYTDPRSRIVIDDAKSYFSGQKNRYDIIVSEPSNPWISGVGALFSKEFYQFIPRHLTDNGLFVQWVQLYEIDDRLVASILAGLTSSTFSDYGAWLANSTDLLIIASKNGPLPPLDAQRVLASPQLKAELASLQLDSTQRLAFRKIANADLLRGLARYYAGLPVNSDFNPVLGLNAPKARYMTSTADGTLSLPFHLPQLLETLGVRPPMPPEVDPSPLDHFIADIYTQRARALAAAMRSQHIKEDTDRRLNDKATLPALQIKALMAECAAPWSAQRSSSFSLRLRELTELTLGHLSAQELQGVLIQPAWAQCANMPTEFRPVFALLDAHARRDYTAMEKLGRGWLEHLPSIAALHADFSPLALSALLYSLAHDGRWSDLLQAADTYGSKVTLDANQTIGLGLMVAVAKNHVAGLVAPNQAKVTTR
jgi:spermidine synthase